MPPRSSGTGGNAAIGLDWYSKRNIGGGLKFNTLLSAPIVQTIIDDNGFALNKNTFTSKAYSFQFIPHVNFKHDFKVVSPVIEIGMLAAITYINQRYESSPTGSNVVATRKMYGNVLLGFYSSLGLDFNVSRRVKITLAVNCTAGSYSPSKWKTTQYSVNGVDMLTSLSTSEMEGVYVKDWENYLPQPNQPSADLKHSIPFSSVGINAGFAFVFGKKKEKAANIELP